MTHSTHTRLIALPVILALALVAGFAFQASGQTDRPVRFAVVVDTSAGPAPARVDAAAAALRRAELASGAEGELRVTRTPTEQLSVTHYFAAQRFDAIVGIGLDEAIAVDPVSERFPATRFAAGLDAVAAAAR